MIYRVDAISEIDLLVTCLTCGEERVVSVTSPFEILAQHRERCVPMESIRCVTRGGDAR